MRQNIVLQCQTHGFVKRRVVADSQNGLFDPTYGRNCCVYVDFFIECLPQKLEIHRSQQAFPLKNGGLIRSPQNWLMMLALMILMVVEWTLVITWDEPTVMLPWLILAHGNNSL